jgi:hypothetical protein
VYHYHRDTVTKFFKQQFNYGFNAVRLYFKHPSFLSSDTKTRGDMFFQPPIALIATLCFLLGILWFPMVYVGLLIALSLLVFHLVSAVRLAKKFDDLPSVPRLLSIFIVRMAAWTVGGVYGSVMVLPALLLRRVRGEG